MPQHEGVGITSPVTAPMARSAMDCMAWLTTLTGCVARVDAGEEATSRETLARVTPGW